MIEFEAPSRRELLTAIGKAGGAIAMYQAMTALGHAAPTQFSGPPKLTGAKPGASVLVLGSGLAGMVAAYEMTKAGYKVTVLEYQDRPGGRNYTVRGGDVIKEVGGAVQQVKFAPGNYLNPGPWRIPFHHQALLHYCTEFGVALEPFIQINLNGYIQTDKAYGGKPQRIAEVGVDFKGHVAELLAKALNKSALDDTVTTEDKAKLLEAMRGWGLLNKDMAYTTGLQTSGQRGFDRPPGGGVDGAPTPSQIAGLADVLDPKVWGTVSGFFSRTTQQTMFQPVGGIDMIGKAFARKLAGKIMLNSKVTKIAQDDAGVTVDYENTVTGKQGVAKADFCVCTIPLPILSQIEVQVSAPKQAAIKALPYHSSCKVGLEMKRRFWEQDEQIYGGHSYTSQSISEVAYPSYGFFKSGPAVLLGAYAGGANAYTFAGMTPAERIETALKQGSVIHKQYRQEFSNGVAVSWTKLPWITACASSWAEDIRKQHYQNLVSVDGRVVLAGEHCSYIGAWMEAALLSSIDAITRLHQRALAGMTSPRRPLIAAAAALAFALGGASAITSAQSLGDTAGTGGTTATSASGEQTYREICAACHMPDARGGTGAVKAPALAANPHLADPDFVLTRVLRGQGGMPAFAEILSPEQVADIAGYVRTHFGNAYPAPVTVADAKRLAPAASGE